MKIPPTLHPRGGDDIFDVILTMAFVLFGTQCLLSDSTILTFVFGPLFILFAFIGVYHIWENNT